MRKTKIIGTVSKKNCSSEVLKQMIQAGCNVVKININSQKRSFVDDVIKKVRDIEKELNIPIGIMLELIGPKLKTDEFKENSILLKKNSEIKIYKYPVLCSSKQFSVNYPEELDKLFVEDKIVINNDIELNVIETKGDYVKCIVTKEGAIYSNSVITFDDFLEKETYLSEVDTRNIEYAIENNIDFLALPDVKTEQDVLMVTDLLIENGDNHLGIYAKIENDIAFENLDEILKVCDGVIFRSNSNCLSIERLPFIQKNILKKVREYEKIGIIASDLNVFSTSTSRSSVIDIYNAIMDNCDAILVNCDNSNNYDSVELIDTANKVILSAEYDFDYSENLRNTIRKVKQDITSSLSYSVVDSSIKLKMKVIVCNTLSGYTATKISYFRPPCPILGFSPDINTMHSLTIVYGVYPRLLDYSDDINVIVKNCVDKTNKMMKLQKNDLIIITGSFPMTSKHTNFMKIEVIEK